MNRKNDGAEERKSGADFLFAGVCTEELYEADAADAAFEYDAENDRILVTFATLSGLLNGDPVLRDRFRSFAGRHPTAKLAAGNSGPAPSAA